MLIYSLVIDVSFQAVDREQTKVSPAEQSERLIGAKKVVQ